MSNSQREEGIDTHNNGAELSYFFLNTKDVADKLEGDSTPRVLMDSPTGAQAWPQGVIVLYFGVVTAKPCSTAHISYRS